MGYFLFVLVNAVLFIRPSEIIPELEAIPIYNILISACLLVSLPALQKELTLRTLVETPINMCVVGLLAATGLSHLSHFQLTYAKDSSIDFFKVVLYYLLLVGSLDSPDRLRRFLAYLVGMISTVAILGLLHYHGVITIASMKVLERYETDATTGQVYMVLQLYGTGIFNDPNDFCMILTLGIGLSLYNLEHRVSILRWLWVVPLTLCGYTLALTNSRGGFLGMLACVLVIFTARFGWKKAVPVAAAILPLMFVLFAGRQTDLSASSGTGQSRVLLWSESLAAFRRVPLFGLGARMLPDEIGAESHNSFVHCYAELGFFGGTLFLGMFAYALSGLIRLGRYQREIDDPDLRGMRPYLLGIVAGYVIGLSSLSRSYVNPTCLVPGLAAAYFRLLAADPSSPVPVPSFDARSVRRLIALSGVYLVVMSIYVRIFARYG